VSPKEGVRREKERENENKEEDEDEDENEKEKGGRACILASEIACKGVYRGIWKKQRVASPPRLTTSPSLPPSHTPAASPIAAVASWPAWC